METFLRRFLIVTLAVNLWAVGTFFLLIMAPYQAASELASTIRRYW